MYTTVIRRTALLLVAVTLLHPVDALDEWVEEWTAAAADSFTLETLATYTDMATRHPRFFGRHVHGSPGRQTPSRRLNVGGPAVERWRPLITRYFPNEVGTALRIIACESRGNPNAKNPSSSAAGLWQFLRSTWDYAAATTGSPSYAQGGPYDPTWATINAAWLRARGSGWNQWTCY